MPVTIRIFVAAALALTIVAVTWTSANSPAATGAATSEKQPSDPDDAKTRAARLEEMRALAGKLVFEEPGAEPIRRHMLVEEPLLRYSDADRGMLDGTLWAYGSAGRPVAILEMYRSRGGDARYRHATTGTCDRPLKLRGAPGIEWTPKSSAIIWDALDADQPPAADEGPRLRQMKALAKRFTAWQIFEPTAQREELRLLAQPLLRYSDAKEKVRDGAVFALALGTNPEALLFIEARDDDQGRAAWHYGWARRGTSGPVHGFLDGEEVWSVKRLLKVTPDDPHVHFFRSLNSNPVLDGPS